MKILKYFFLVLLYPLFTIQISAQPRSSVQPQSIWAVNPPVIDGQIDWTDTRENKIKLSPGWMQVQNDADYLYILLDLTMDTSPDEPLSQAPWGDFFAISFDVDTNRMITPNTDVQYGFYPGQLKLGFQYYLEPSAWTGLNSSNAKIASGFNSSYNSESPHRIWEAAIPLSEINSAAGRIIRMGLDTYSQNPNFRYYDPPGFSNDFSNLIELKTSVKLLLRDSDLRVLRRRGQIITADTSTNKEPVVVKRTINQDGNAELLYSDGSKKILFDGGYTLISPDGKERSRALYSQVQKDYPTELPGDQNITDWLNSFTEGLLDVIKSIVHDNDALNYYLQKEGEIPRMLYEKMYYRLTYIERLTSE